MLAWNLEAATVAPKASVAVSPALLGFHGESLRGPVRVVDTPSLGQLFRTDLVLLLEVLVAVQQVANLCLRHCSAAVGLVYEHLREIQTRYFLSVGSYPCPFCHCHQYQMVQTWNHRD